MGLRERFRTSGRAAAGGSVQADTSEQDALRLIDEGNALEDEGRIDEALRRYEAALRLAPNLARAHLNRGNVLQATGDVEGALDAYAQALVHDPNYAAAHYNMGNACVRAGRHQAALAAYRAAIALKPDFADAEVALGSGLQALGHLDGAMASYSRALQINPNLPGAHFMLGNVLISLGRPAEALESYRQAAAIQPDFAEAHCNVGNALKDLKQLHDAVASYRRALEIKPDFAEAHGNLGNALRDLGQLDDAIASYQQALRIKPDFAEAHCNLGNALKDLWQLDDAVASYRRAVKVDPNLAEAHSNLGNALTALGQLDNAVASCRRALKIKPDYVEAYSNLGNALKELGRIDEALASYRRALEIKPDFAVAHYNLAKALRDIGQLDSALASYRQALQINPDYVEAHCNLGNALLGLGRLDDAVASCRRSLELKADFAEAYTNLLFCLSHNEAIGAQALFVEHCRFGGQFEGSVLGNWPVHGNSRDPARCLQIGFVSGDLRKHPVAYFLEPVLAHLGVSPGFALHAYYNHAVEDSVSARLRGHMKHWHSIAGLSDAAVARKIGDDGIDILIDMSGHTGENRLLCFARKPAPIQASWMGYPGTTGLRAMDYYLADRYFLPPGEFDSQFTEKLVYLPASAPFLPDESAPPVNALPALSKGYVTFGSFNRISKLRPSAIALWARLLRALPSARMVLGGMPQEGSYDALVDLFAGEGIVRERLSFYSRCPIPAYLALHHQVDICLDTFPYTGGTTTNHALWMGVPTLTLAGHTPPGRQGAAILGHVGLEAFVAEDAEDFQVKGLSWAGDLAALAAVRAGLRERCERSPMRHPELIAAGVESALRTMWQRWCAGLPAETIDMSS